MFVPNFAAVTAPLTNLLIKEINFTWSGNCQKVLEMVKIILASESVAVAQDSSLLFKLAVDTCEVGGAAELLHTV